MSGIREFIENIEILVMSEQRSAGNADAVETGKITSALRVLAISGFLVSTAVNPGVGEVCGLTVCILTRRRYLSGSTHADVARDIRF